MGTSNLKAGQQKFIWKILSNVAAEGEEIKTKQTHAIVNLPENKIYICSQNVIIPRCRGIKLLIILECNFTEKM